MQASEGRVRSESCAVMEFGDGKAAEEWRRKEDRTSLKGKGKEVTLVHALRLSTGRTARRGGGRGTALPFHDHGTRRG